MHPRTAVFLLALLLGIPAALIAWRNKESARATEAAIVIAIEKRNEAEHRRQQAKDQRELALAALEKSRTAEVSSTEVAKKPSPPTEVESSLQVRQLAAEKARLRTNYEPLFGKWGLSPAQIARFMEMVVRREEQQMDVTGVVRARGLSDRDPIANRLRNEAQLEFKAAQRELLGEARFKELEEFEQLKYVRSMVAGLVGAATVQGAPFTAQQAEQLVQAIAATDHRRQEGTPVTIATVDWAEVDLKARSFLNEAQWKAWKTSEPAGSGFSSGRLTQQLFAAVERARAAELQREKPTPAP